MQIDLIILTYNRANLLKKAIESVLEQTYKKFRLIILDDNSTDNTKEVVESFQDNRIVYIKNEKNLGMFKNWQKALSYIKGDYFHPMLADDDYFIDKYFLEKGVSILKKEELDILFFGMKKNINGESIIDKPKNLKFNQLYAGIDIAKNFLDYQFYCNTNGLYKAKFINILTQDLKPDAISDELVIMFKLLLSAKKVKLLDSVNYCWNYDHQSYSNQNRSSLYFRVKNHLNFIDKIIPILKENSLEKEFKKSINCYMFYMIEDVEMNYYLSKIDKIFDNLLLNNINECYIYGRGIVGIELKKYLEENGIKVLGFIDDYRSDCLNIDGIDKSKKIIISTFKKSLVHKMYKKLIENGIDYKNIKELI